MENRPPQYPSFPDSQTSPDAVAVFSLAHHCGWILLSLPVVEVKRTVRLISKKNDAKRWGI